MSATNGEGYTEAQRTEFVELAQQLGQGPAMRKLGFPRTHTTARKWLEQAGVHITVDSMREVNAMRGYYKQREQALIAQKYLQRLYKQYIRGGKDLSPSDYKRVGEAMQLGIQALQLVTGEPTTRTEQISSGPTDKEIERLMRELAGDPE